MKYTDHRGISRPVSGNAIDPTFAAQIATIAAALLAPHLNQYADDLADDDPAPRAEMIREFVKLAVDMHDEAGDEIARRSEARLVQLDAELGKEPATVPGGQA